MAYDSDAELVEPGHSLLRLWTPSVNIMSQFGWCWHFYVMWDNSNNSQHSQHNRETEIPLVDTIHHVPMSGQLVGALDLQLRL